MNTSRKDARTKTTLLPFFGVHRHAYSHQSLCVSGSDSGAWLRVKRRLQNIVQSEKKETFQPLMSHIPHLCTGGRRSRGGGQRFCPRKRTEIHACEHESQLREHSATDKEKQKDQCLLSGQYPLVKRNKLLQHRQTDRPYTGVDRPATQDAKTRAAEAV